MPISACVKPEESFNEAGLRRLADTVGLTGRLPRRWREVLSTVPQSVVRVAVNQFTRMARRGP